MAVNDGYLQYTLEQLAGLGSVTTRRMFGGAGLYRGDSFFGLISGSALYFKVDDSNRGDYEARGMSPFRPHRDKPHVSLSYYEVPAAVLEDSEELVCWARRSLAIAAAAPRPKPRRRLARRNP